MPETTAPAQPKPRLLDVGNEALDCSQASSESWLTDPCLWQPIPELASCEVYWAKLPSSRFPARSFTECGQGCRFTNGPADGSDGLFRLPRGWFDTRSSYVLLNTFVEEIEIREVVNVTENREKVAELRGAVTREIHALLRSAPRGALMVEHLFLAADIGRH